ncbi:MAG: glycogen-binding domain-containing protein [Planctomycetota bacterium]|nr:glycogen-binding domain-containing protein [Planctomycetota bacterium]
MVHFHENGEVEFAVYLPNARRVRIAGTFSDWQPGEDLVAGEDGWWRLRMRPPLGDQEFQYFVDDEVWLPDYAAGGVRLNRWGTWVSLLTMAAPVREKVGSENPIRRLAA